MTRTRAWMVMGALLLAPRPALAYRNMRCGNDFVEVGDTMETVARKCGAPDKVQIRPLPSGRPIVVWVYDFGRNQFVQHAHFDAGLLFAVYTHG